MSRVRGHVTSPPQLELNTRTRRTTKTLLRLKPSALHFFYLQRRLHGSNGSARQRLGLTLVPAVSVTDAQEEHAGGQTSWQGQGHVAAEVCSTGRRSRWLTADGSATLNNSRPTVRTILPKTFEEYFFKLLFKSLCTFDYLGKQFSKV